MRKYGVISNEQSELELKNRSIAREIAREGFVLLKNNGALPLKDKKNCFIWSWCKKNC